MYYKVGVTGTRSGMTEFQRESVIKILTEIIEEKDVAEFHHGDCVGVDVESAAIAMDLGYKIVCHPPIKDDLRGNFNSDETRQPLSYFARNRKIVDECDILLVVPYQDEWQSNGGTWYTHDYAVKKNKTFLIFYPNPFTG